MRRLLYQAATLFLLWAPRLGMAQHLPGRGAVDSAGLITPGTCLTLRFTDATTAVQWCPTATNAGEWRNASGTAFLDWDTSALTLTARQLRLEAALPFTQAAGSAGDIIINSGATPSPGLKFYTAGDTNFAIRGSSATLQFVYKLGETGATTAGTLTSSGEWTSAAAASAAAFTASTQGARFCFNSACTSSISTNGSGSTDVMLRTNSANNFLFDGSGNLFLGADLYPGQLVQASTAGEGLRLKGTATNGATAQALKFANVNALTTDGAKIASFYSDNLSTERAYVSYVGAIRPHVSITTTPAAPYTCTTSHEGEIFYFRDTDVGAGSTGKHCGCTCDGATPTCSWKRLVDDSACP